LITLRHLQLQLHWQRQVLKLPLYTTRALPKLQRAVHNTRAVALMRYI
jgi:hypothetical protein